jgi:hypothetical protein
VIIARALLLILWLGGFWQAAHAGSLYFGESRPEHYDFADLPRLPATFGAGEFTFEIWIRPDHRFPVGSTMRGTKDQLKNWSSADPEPYSDPGWWHAGNWLIDGHSRPNGFGPTDSRAGTFSLQFYGGGRLRWMFADSDQNMPVGMVYAVQAAGTSSTPSLLDGRWHHVAALRRWREPDGAVLELWIDGAPAGRTEIPLRVDMRRFWGKPPHPENPSALGGWTFGAEVMTAWDFFFTQYEDYKGWIDEMRFWSRALAPAEIARAAHGADDQLGFGLLGRFAFTEGAGDKACDSIDPDNCMTLHRMTPKSWSSDDASHR